MQKEKKLSYIIQNLILITIVIVTSLISNLTSFSDYTPFYEMTIIFFACVASPRAMPFSLLFIYGILRDILFSYPIGCSSLLFINFKAVIDFQLQFIESHTTWRLWLQFAFCLLITLALQATILSVAFEYDFYKLLFAFLKRWYFTSLLYPCFHLFYGILTKFIGTKDCYVAE
jgi:hypothetical protein